MYFDRENHRSSYIHRIVDGDIIQRRNKNALVPVAAKDLLPVSVCNDLRHRERHPDAAVKRFRRKQNPVFQPPEAQRIFQVLVDIEQIAVIDDQVQLIARRVICDEAADRFKALAVCRDAARKLMIDRIRNSCLIYFPVSKTVIFPCPRTYTFTKTNSEVISRARLPSPIQK